MPVLLSVVFVLIIAGCQSAPEEIPPNLSQMEMFQRAQEAADEDDYDQALRYYQEFIARYPDDESSIIEAEYEIAFIAYKQERYDEALSGFNAILASYDDGTGRQLPEWPRVLSARLIERIDELQAASDETG